MELKEFIKILKKRFLWITVCAFLGLLGGLAFYLTRPKPMFEARALLFVTRASQPAQENFYTYDGFHAQQTAYHYADTVLGLARTLGAESAIRKSEQLIEITNLSHINKPSPEAIPSAEQNIRHIVNEIINASKDLNTQGDQEISIQLVNDKVSVHEIKQNLYLILAVGIAVGVGVGVFLASLKEYLNG